MNIAKAYLSKYLAKIEKQGRSRESKGKVG